MTYCKCMQMKAKRSLDKYMKRENWYKSECVSLHIVAWLTKAIDFVRSSLAIASEDQPLTLYH